MYEPDSRRNRLSNRTRGVGSQVKASQMLDAFFDPNNIAVRSFREAYQASTGDMKVTGRTRDCEPITFREAIGSGTWASGLGDSITRAMLKEYRGSDLFGIWRKIAKIGPPIRDFRTQERVRYGGYGDLPAVAENAAYAALTTPTDEKATYALSKRGGTETITLEAITNDDVGAIQNIPKKLAKAAERTLAKFVLGFLKSNPVIYDGNPLFDVLHNNLGSAALSAASVAAARSAMVKQTEPGSGDQIGQPPVSLLVPFDLEEVAFNLFQRGTNNDKTFVERMALEVVPVWDWLDPSDWVIAADPQELPCIEMGFYNGQEDPELFLQDSPIQGSLFSNDQLKYKIRHIYGGTVTDYRGLYKSVVA